MSLTPVQKIEIDLVERAKTDEKAFKELYDYYFARIYGYVIKRVNYREMTEDIVSETFMKAFVNLNKYQYRGVSFGAWLYRIASNLIVDHYRQSKKIIESSMEELLEMPSNSNTEILANTGFDQVQVNKLLDQLDDFERNIIELKFYAQLSNIEIGDIAELNPNNVGVIIYRVLKKLKKFANN